MPDSPEIGAVHEPNATVAPHQRYIWVTRHKAKKWHDCYHCGGPIKTGMRYSRTTVIDREYGHTTYLALSLHITCIWSVGADDLLDDLITQEIVHVRQTPRTKVAGDSCK